MAMKKKKRGRPAGVKNASGAVKKGKRGRPAGSKTSKKTVKRDETWSIAQSGVGGKTFLFVQNDRTIMTKVTFGPDKITINGVDCDIRDVMLSIRRVGKKFAD